MTPREAMSQAIDLFGSEKKLGRAIGVSQNAIWRAKTVGRATAEMCVCIEAVTNGKIKRAALRPDLFGAKAQIIPHSWSRYRSNKPPRKQSAA